MFRHVLIVLVILQTAALPSYASEIQQGKVDWWGKDKGIGFITPDNADPKIFVSSAHNVEFFGLIKDLSPGMCIRYEIEEYILGDYAHKLQLC